MAKRAHNENVTTDILIRICEALSCDIGDIAEITYSKNIEQANSRSTEQL